ncbi:MAG: hypothetical protein H6832_00450 [Planctomycetes bacterium]|nr:hypothetical protein [Planctomycetota bacterium]MCB9916852.1 hypothetical protein [Planctomycetota bacterium]
MPRSSRDEYECYKSRRREVARRGPELGARDFDRLLRRHDQLQLRDIERGLGVEDRARLAELTRLLLLDRHATEQRLPEPFAFEEGEDLDTLDVADDELRDTLHTRDELRTAEPQAFEDVEYDEGPRDDGRWRTGSHHRAAIDESPTEDGVHDALSDSHDELHDEASIDGPSDLPCTNASRLGNPIPSAATRRLRWQLGRRGSRT